jgi:hypothetical protein
MDYEGDQKQHQENNKQQLGDPGRRNGDPGES